MEAATFQLAVEGDVDEQVARGVCAAAGVEVGSVFGKTGKADILKRLRGFNGAAAKWPWLVVVDLDRDAACAPSFVKDVLPRPAEFMCFRVAVRAVEAWLMADRERFSAFMGVAESRLPRHPDEEADAKACVISLLERSSRKDVVRDMRPRPESGRKVGPAYSSRLMEFVRTRWRATEAERSSPSLARCLASLRRVSARWRSRGPSPRV